MLDEEDEDVSEEKPGGWEQEAIAPKKPKRPPCPTEFEEESDIFNFTVKGKDGRIRFYQLREIDGEDRDKYLNIVLSRQAGSGSNLRVKRLDGLQSILLSRCCWHLPNATAEDPGNPEGAVLVKEKELIRWKAKPIDSLFNKAMEMNGLEKEAEEQEGND